MPFGELLGELDHADVEVALARARHPVLDMLERSGLLDRIGKGAVFFEVDDAVERHRPFGGDPTGPREP